MTSTPHVAEEDDASYKTQEKVALSNDDKSNKNDEEEDSTPSNEFPESPDDARYLTTVMEDEEDEGGYHAHQDDEDAVSMPLFQYNRVFGSLPRASAGKLSPLSKRRSCAAMGKVILFSETIMASNETENSAGTLPDLWQQHPIHVAAYGFEQGHISVVDAVSGVAVAEPDKFQIRERRNNNHSHTVIALSWDASGTYLAALDDGGMCAIFEIKYSIQMRDVFTSTSEEQAGGNLFTHFISALTRGGHSNPEDTRPAQRVPALTAALVQVHRIPYPSSFGKPTCLAIDPAYKKRREKSVIVGFADGRLVLTRKGFVFQRRSDAVIYQAVKDDDFAGIEAITWRGSLVAWADSSGVRLLDVDVLQRIAHIDRPSGARSSLYPSVSRVHPSLCFETENDLLVAWGDCLLRLNIRDFFDGASSSSVSLSEGSSVVAQRRRVECKMAWELDCIACGVVPIDAKHIAVLGLVSDDTESEDDNTPHENDIELQVISRIDGAVVFADIIPLVRAKKKSHHQDVESSIDFNLLSSFVIPRMDNTSEVQEMESLSGGSGAVAFDPLQGGMFGKSNIVAARFRDSHVVWGLEQVVVQDENILLDKDSYGKTNIVEGDDTSVDSDDYDFAITALPNSILDVSDDSEKSIPPIIILASSHDIVLARTRDADDAVSYALEQGKYALALHRGLQHVRRLRRYNIDELTNQYFRALLRISDSSNSSIAENRPLSIRRLKIAAQVMPILLGGKVNLWVHWLKELERLPGGLFVARNAIPVRDPQLEQEVYDRMITSMLQQVYDVKASVEAGKNPKRLEIEAEQHFLLSLLSWGTIHVLNEFVQLFETQSTTNSFIRDICQGMVTSQKQRREQTAANYLNFNTPTILLTDNSPTQVNNAFELQKSLYNLDHIALIVEERISLKREILADSGKPLNSKFALDAAAMLSMMRGNFEAMLAYYMALGIFHNALTLESLEEMALKSIAPTQDRQATIDGHQERYSFVMSLIEKHHLHQFILEDRFLPADLDKSPLEALIMLVGLECLGNFLCKHCAAPQNTQSSSTAKRRIKAVAMGEQRIGTLPIDQVAKQLERRPKLLHWYLHLIFEKRPELYVKFPTTSVPPSIITDLHRRHLELHIQYAGTSRDSSKVFDGIEPYKTVEVMTPFLRFLKAVLPLGGIDPVEVGKMLDNERKQETEKPNVFALELAYIMEHFGNGSSEDVSMVLELYLKGARSLVLAVSYAQRAGKHSLELWHTLIEHCLSPDAETRSAIDVPKKENSSLFGSLLEAAALSGADVALLVNQIPHGMAVEGLRPRLVAAVADYRLQLQMHESASKIATSERAALLSEYSHRSRRGFRCSATPTIVSEKLASGQILAGKGARANESASPKVTLPQTRTRRPQVRSDHQSLCYSLPLR